MTIIATVNFFIRDRLIVTVIAISLYFQLILEMISMVTDHLNQSGDTLDDGRQNPLLVYNWYNVDFGAADFCHH